MTELTTPLRALDAAVERIRAHVATRPRRGIAHDDADDTVGTIDSDEAVDFDPRPLLAAFDRHGARVVVIGQVAGILHGSEELTGDLDLLWSGTADEAPKLVAAFADVDASLFDDDHHALDLTVDALALAKVLFASPSASGDCCTPRLPWGALDIEGTLARAVRTHDGRVTVHYAALPDLIAMRRAAGRPKDLRRAAELDALNGRNGPPN
ncbi:MAG TPA: hypothetical protein VH914_18255 [Acidimicrobiia bacterium]|nr:hypothetical protein [Acidimicrobiia bacterium]